MGPGPREVSLDPIDPWIDFDGYVNYRVRPVAGVLQCDGLAPGASPADVASFTYTIGVGQ